MGRAERLENPEDFIPFIMEKVKREHIVAQYKLTKKDSKFENHMQLMEAVAIRSGRLRKGGDPCFRSAAIMIIYDFHRGRLPHYVAPPELKEKEEVVDTANVEGLEQLN